jgi:hypothetical protein
MYSLIIILIFFPIFLLKQLKNIGYFSLIALINALISYGIIVYVLVRIYNMTSKEV